MILNVFCVIGNFQLLKRSMADSYNIFGKPPF